MKIVMLHHKSGAVQTPRGHY